MRAIALTVVCLVGVMCAGVLLRYGTLAPCGILRVQVREQGTREGQFVGALATILPDAALDAVIQAAYGPLTPGQCLGLVFNRDQQRTATPPVVAQPPARSNIPAQIEHGGTQGWAGSTCYMDECFDQIILGTAKDGDGVITALVQLRKYDVRRPWMTLGLPTMTYRALCRSPGGYIETGPSRRIMEPNPMADHSTEPADKMWAAVCSKQ